MKTLRQVLKGLVLAIVLSVLIISGMRLKNTLSRVSADRVDKKTDKKVAPIRDKNNNTAQISEKEAWWTDQEAYEANLLLKVNGSSLSGPMDVVFVLDRSGSMDMTYTDNANADGYKGYPLFSSSCLNQEHFYLEPLHEGQEPEANADKSKVYENSDNTLTVYNADVDKWEVISTTPVHLFEQFTQATAKYIPYHFKKEGEKFVRISRWDATAKVAGKTEPGVWVHGDEDQGCYDRWMLSKEAISEVTNQLLQEHPENRVALAPFSIRDSSMVTHLNYNSQRMKNFRDNLVLKNNEHGYFGPSTGTTIEADGSISGVYNSTVGWKGSIAENKAAIDDMLPRLFTTPQTDYQYGLSMAYNLLQIDPNYLKLIEGTTYKVAGMGAEMLTVDYMANSAILKTMSNDSQNYFEVPADNVGAGKRYLSDLLLNSTLFPGGRDSVLRDKVSQYYYVPENATLPQGVTIEGNYEDKGEEQTIVWELGDLYDYSPDGYPSVNIPLVLKEEYRQVSQDTYYPTNADTSYKARDILDPERGIDDEDTGAKLYYTDPHNQKRYDTIGTPKLAVNPPAVKSTSYQIQAEKLLSGRSLLGGEFTFELLDSAGGVIQTVHNDASGKIVFSPITYTNTGDYDYTVREKVGLDKTIDYDAANYKVTVSIKEEAGNLVATATGDAAIQFKNSYQPLGTEIHLQATKELVGKKLTDQEFTFELVNASNQIIQTAKNDASGQIRFDKLAYTKTGSYDYTIREKAGVDPQITYDTKSYKIHVEVSDQKGKLVASVSYEQEPKFKNIYLEEKRSSSKDDELKGLTEKKRPQKKILPKAGEFNKTAAIVIGIGLILVGFVTLLMRKVRRNRK
ncbi:Spy0128 family protein [Lactococcus formosensis]|jgi:pilin isopeptide linkage protein/LPXTG-motif cell wall-anchored protein|uniref:LPXTG cell wall anchor domain-containing protein n=1 Tax=Lactococcus formosensis TaxID=1281486 RepID=A0A9Q9D5W5_9LACT|nr:FctA domain-containing protein [Lactococcus formosensis]USJ19374.1 LPXTG cell wall anchor domain-containing protein [Lactococcus formosensis]